MQSKGFMKFLISTGVSLLCSLLLAVLKGLFSAAGKDFLHILSDCFTIPGLLFICAGVLMLLTDTGIYDGIGYLFTNVVRALVPFGRNNRPKKYADYVAEHRKKEKVNYWFLVETGAFDLLLSLLVLFFYYR